MNFVGLLQKNCREASSVVTDDNLLASFINSREAIAAIIGDIVVFTKILQVFLRLEEEY